MITPDAADNAMLTTALKAADYDCVVICGGLRIPRHAISTIDPGWMLGSLRLGQLLREER
jgi:hypothetical protein